MQSLLFRRHLVALQKMQEYARKGKRRILEYVQRYACFCRKGLERLPRAKVRTTFLPETMGKHCLSILWEFLQEYTPLVRLCFDTCMQERHQQKDCTLEWKLEETKIDSRVQPAIHKDPGEVRCTLSLERIPIQMALES